MELSDELQEILIFTAVGAGFITLTLFISRLLSPSKPNPEKNQVYESGEEPLGNYWPSISNGYFVIALLFILFEIEVILLFPLAVVFGKSSTPSEEILLWSAICGFILVLVAGLVYAWGNGHLDWMRPKPGNPEFRGPVPSDRYEAFNKKING